MIWKVGLPTLTMKKMCCKFFLLQLRQSKWLQSQLNCNRQISWRDYLHISVAANSVSDPELALRTVELALWIPCLLYDERVPHHRHSSWLSIIVRVRRAVRKFAGRSSLTSAVSLLGIVETTRGDGGVCVCKCGWLFKPFTLHFALHHRRNGAVAQSAKD